MLYSIQQLRIIPSREWAYHQKLWSYIKSQRKDISGYYPTLSQNGSLYADPNQKAEILNIYFSSVFSDKESTVPSTENVLFQVLLQLLLICME